MLSVQEMSDRLEIQDLLARYCEAIDSHDWDALDDIFTADAIIDYTAAGGAKGNLPETKAYLERALEQFFNPMVVERDGQPHTLFVGIWYCDELIRTKAGWRIQHRREELSYFHNLPTDFAAVET